MAAYSILYLFVLGSTLVACAPQGSSLHRVRGASMALMLALLALFAGLRASGVDADGENYVYWFDQVRQATSLDYALVKDPAFYLVAVTIAALGMGTVALFLAFACIALGIKWRLALTVPDARYAQFFLYLYFCRFYLVHEMTQIRSGVAVGMAALALLLYYQRRNWWGIALFVLAVMFHLSVILILPFFLLVAMKRPLRARWPMAMLAGIALLFMAVSETVFSVLGIGEFVRLADYLNGAYETAGISLISLYFLFKVAILLWLVMTFWERLRHFDRLVIYLVMGGVFLQIAFVSNDAVALRAAEVFCIFDLLMFIMPLPFLKKYMRAGYGAGLLMIGLLFFASSLKIMNPYQLSLS